MGSAAKCRAPRNLLKIIFLHEIISMQVSYFDPNFILSINE